MRILLLSPRQCWPPDSGAKIREYYLARALGRRGELTHVSFTQHGFTEQNLTNLPFCRRLISAPAPKRYTYSKLIWGVLGRHPLPLLNYYSSRMSAVIDQVLQDGAFDLIQLESVHMAAYIPLIRRRTDAPIVIDWHNIESEAMRRYGAGERSPARKAYALLTAGKLEAFERELLQTAFGHAVCSWRERAELKRLQPEARVEVIENGVDTKAFAVAGPAAKRNRILFVGSMDYRPNVGAIVWFAREIWPRIRELFPEWRLTIVGSNPTAAVLALRSEAGVEVTGRVADVSPYYQEAVAAIAPLKSGGGTRLKILEAMASGTPVISTILGAEGLSVTPGRNILIAETGEEWVAHLNALASGGMLWQRLAAAGRELVCARYDWDAIGETLYETYSGWLEAVAA